jgi:hypothetical protein
MNAFYLALGGLVFLFIGYRVYRARWPEGLWPAEEYDTIERIRRVGRKRVLPLPLNRGPVGHRRGGGRR